MTGRSLLKVRDLSVRFGEAEPVRELSFEVMEGRTLAIVGESGSGKSLTALSLMRLLPRTATVSGTAFFDGKDLFALNGGEARQIRGRDIAMIFQEPMTALNPVMKIGKQITEGIRQHAKLSSAQARKRAIELLDLVRIAEPQRRFDDYPHRLSGGMRQRVMIAIAVACSPRLLIADEPTTALDVTIQAQILELLDTLRKDLSMALMLITHDLGVVSQWADDVVVMYAGRTLECAASSSIFASPMHPYTQGLLAASPGMSTGLHYTSGRLRVIPGSIAFAASEPGCCFSSRCPFSIVDCRSSTPAMRDMGAGRQVACIRAPIAGERHGSA